MKNLFDGVGSMPKTDCPKTNSLPTSRNQRKTNLSFRIFFSPFGFMGAF